MLTPLEMTQLRRDLLRWVALIDGLLAAQDHEATIRNSRIVHGKMSEPRTPLLAELSILIRPHEADMLTRLADEIPDLPADMGEVDRMRAALRYCFHLVHQQVFEVETTGAVMGKSHTEPKELTP